MHISVGKCSSCGKEIIDSQHGRGTSTTTTPTRRVGMSRWIVLWSTRGNCEAKPPTLSVVIHVGACSSQSTINTCHFFDLVRYFPMVISTHNLFHEEGTSIEKILSPFFFYTIPHPPSHLNTHNPTSALIPKPT